MVIVEVYSIRIVLFVITVLNRTPRLESCRLRPEEWTTDDMMSLLSDDFDDFCSRASDLAAQSNGAPLLTVAQSCNSMKPARHCETLRDNAGVHDDDRSR